ncbi:MAG: DUF2062 domain-containing protein [Prochloraceae cyanobacterium]
MVKYRKHSSLRLFSASSKSNTSKSRAGKFSWSRVVRYWYVRLVRLRGTPPAIARGLACGVFAGCFPLFGCQTIIGIVLAILFRGNKIAAAAGTWVSNPLTYVPIYAFNYQVGSLLLGKNQISVPQVDLQSWSELLALGSTIVGIVFIGCLIVGLIAAIVTYFLSLRFIRSWRKPHKSRRYQRIKKYPKIKT